MSGDATNERPTLPGADDRGFVLAQTALLMVPLFIFAAFATDVGYWYAQGQKSQRAADAAATAAVMRLPNSSDAIDEARAVAARNGYVDATPDDNGDFDTGPLPQLQVTIPRSGAAEVRIRTQERSFLGRLVTDGIVIERFAVAQYAADVHLGNPTSGLGTGTISEQDLGMPSDRTWLAVNGYCHDRRNGDQFLSGYTSGTSSGVWRVCGPEEGVVAPEAAPTPTFDPNAYVFAVEIQPNSPPIDLSIYEPGIGCTDTGTTNDAGEGPRIFYRVYGPSTTLAHRSFVENNAPIEQGLFPEDACVANSPNGDGWWPLLTGASGGQDGAFYYVQVATRNPLLVDLDPADPYWAEININYFSLKATRHGTSALCTFSSVDPLCPKLFAVDWLPLMRTLGNDQTDFFLAEVPEYHRGGTMYIRMFDVADGVDNVQFVGPAGAALPFEWRYADQTLGQVNEGSFLESAFQAYNRTCPWGGTDGNPCLDTRVREDFNDHFVEVKIDIPNDYTCGGDCWWKVRYNTLQATGDRTNWAVDVEGSPVQLVE